MESYLSISTKVKIFLVLSVQVFSYDGLLGATILLRVGPKVSRTAFLSSIVKVSKVDKCGHLPSIWLAFWSATHSIRPDNLLFKVRR